MTGLPALQLYMYCLDRHGFSGFFYYYIITGLCYGLPKKVTDEPPSWGNVYSVQGTLMLPYAEIVEPFSSWYDATNKRSRVDFYGGMTLFLLLFFFLSTLQLSQTVLTT